MGGRGAPGPRPPTALGGASLPSRGDGYVRGRLDGAGTDFAIKYVHSSWRYHKITAARLYDDLAGLPEKLTHVDSLADRGVIDGDAPTAADLQIGATLRVLLTVGDLRPLLHGRPSERIARRWFPDYAGDVPVGAFPAGWVARTR